MFMVSVELLPLLFGFSTGVDIYSISPSASGTVMTVLSPFPQGANIGKSSVTGRGRPALLGCLTPCFPVGRRFPAPAGVVSSTFMDGFATS